MPGNRKRMRIVVALAFFSQWSGNGLVWYYLNDALDHIGFTSPTIQLLTDGMLRRRFLFLTSCTGMFTLRGADCMHAAVPAHQTGKLRTG
ncbi:hypothetical protein FIBSPDRAFT_867167 [Athelia psychrophila]|uniref:Major facilitator superfamily (MFS) profile domain-containing protein n=1 Tax=Athelia psychrophila TaxID=1759441 RepID=A0A166E5U9_9AGAM|nr:hypothetical protein FIBSPDRAFT_867167 [Fibularhizoctonia sp. CBS 109695]